MSTTYNIIHNTDTKCCHDVTGLAFDAIKVGKLITCDIPKLLDILGLHR